MVLASRLGAEFRSLKLLHRCFDNDCYPFDCCSHIIESLPNAIVQYVLSYMNNAQDVALCNCISKRWKDSLPYLRSLYFPRNSFDNLTGSDTPDDIVLKMISLIERLETLVVYSPFSSAGLASWLAVTGPSLRYLKLRMDNLAEQEVCNDCPSKLDCLTAAKSLESLKLWGVLMTCSPEWDVFLNLKNLEIVGARLEDPALSTVLRACPNLTKLVLLGCEGIVVSIELPHLEQCKLDFDGLGNCSFSMKCPKIEVIEVQGCSWIRVQKTKHLRNLSIANNAGNKYLCISDDLK
ncbi:F-box protein At1g10780-like [Argentina anserina]|uniref:F-box protein At1g10780-like n=1 Tax=Argentina anserina TaxID=57926 RepID=UPI0021767F48|nr:F-box protein At1g10780-like [Potentilla anserina]